MVVCYSESIVKVYHKYNGKVPREVHKQFSSFLLSLFSSLMVPLFYL